MQTSDETPKQWDIVVVPFPYTDQLAEKRRPALVVSGLAFNQDTGLLWVVMVTSTSIRWSGDIEITDHEKAGLPVRSFIRTAKIATIESNRILRVAGTITDDNAQKTLTTLTGNMNDIDINKQ